MPNNPIVFLANEQAQNDGFKKKRFVPPPEQEENEDPKVVRNFQKEKLRTNNALFFSQRKARLEQKTLSLPSVVDLVEIHFFTVFNSDLQKKFFKQYGLEIVSYKNFNKSVLFEIGDPKAFQEFVTHVSAVVESSDGESYQGKPYSLIALINNFEFYGTKSRIEVLAGEGCLISLMPSISDTVTRQIAFLKEYLKEKEIPFSFNDAFPDLFEINSLSLDGIKELALNFDVIRVITSAHQVRIRPGIYGTTRRDYGFEVEIEDNLPVVGIIDSGVSNIAPLRDLLTRPTYDHSGYGANFDELGHGTMVAGLVAFGDDLPRQVLDVYKAHARIAVLKTLHNDGDSLNVPRLLSEIKDANQIYGIRLFNMSVNIGSAKKYNQPASDFAYELDKLAYELDILIVISVGNFNADDLRELVNGGQLYHPSHEYPVFFYDLDSTSLYHSCWHTNLKEPAESLNNISVGALAGNLEDRDVTDISPLAELPAYYTRKFHYDITQDLNGTPQSTRQHSRHLNKPDLVIDGGDIHREEAGIEILSAPTAATGHYFGRTAGTSIAAPLVTNYAARLLHAYPQLRMQSIKALLINNAQLPAGKNPHIFRNFKIDLYKKLVGFGKPSTSNLIATDDNTVTFVMEDTIGIDEVKVIPLNVPSLMTRGGDKFHVTMTLCYSFQPVHNNQLSYLPLQIVFGAFASTDADTIATQNADTFRIKNGVSWSEDFFGVEKRQFSNTQKLEFNLNAKNVADIGDQIGLAVRCTMKKEIPEADKKRIENSQHRFSIAITIIEIPEAKASGTLFADLTAINTIKTIAEAEGTADIELMG